MGAGITIQVYDAPDSAYGVWVPVSGPFDEYARVNIDRSTGIYKLSPGQHTLTSGSVTLNVLYGLAVAEFIVGGVPSVVVVQEGSTAIFNETIVGDNLQTLVVDAVEGKVTVNGNTVPPGGNLIMIPIDIKPGSNPNCFNPDGHGVIPVAILGSPDFDVSQINYSTLSFEGVAVRIKRNDKPQCSIEDVSGDFSASLEGAPDGFDDLVCQFVDTFTDGWISGDGAATVNGNLYDGTLIQGSDSICVVP
jgi:hypothetical protein